MGRLSKCSTPELHSQAFPMQLYIAVRLSKGSKRLGEERVRQTQGETGKGREGEEGSAEWAE